ncbi:tryptophan synthase subunit alpha [Buchnera aphidicola]|uniref:tryptophan synthase subunit alpha n=1 Tax=Buchnera aphidicola TaxID=9 RepID=UPI0031B83328
MSRYKQTFQKLKSKKEGCFIPYITIGDPSIDVFYEIIDILIESGANALELGIPFSDPVADGVVVQNANIRALKNKINLSTCFKIIEKIRTKYSFIPIGILIYANVIFNYGIENFYKTCKLIEIDSVLIPDLPIEESKEFIFFSQKNNVSEIFICPPNAKKKLIKKISKTNAEYIYLISRTGVTGYDKTAVLPNIKIIQTIKKYTSKPIIHGFGISSTQHIKQSLSLGTDGIICGSIIIQLIASFYYKKKIMLMKIQDLSKILKNSTKMN